MGMTIAKPIQTLEYLRDSGVFPFGTKEGVLYTVESIDVAIEIMHKYQKIQEIVKSWEDDSWTDGISEDCMEKISEVMEDGDID